LYDDAVSSRCVCSVRVGELALRFGMTMPDLKSVVKAIYFFTAE
jgi:hypothetical protein